jgi:hypothetical protein
MMMSPAAATAGIRAFAFGYGHGNPLGQPAKQMADFISGTINRFQLNRLS